jgi:MFS family permease
MRRNPWIIWGTATSFYFLRVILFVAFGVFGAKIQAALAIGAGVFGSLGGFAYTVYGALQLPLGLLLDRIGPRLILTISCGVCVAGSVAFALGTNVFWAVLASVLIGGGSAIAYVGAMSLSRHWFQPGRFAYVVGLTILVGSLGGAATQELFAVLVKWADWRTIMMALAGTGILIMTLLWSIIPDERATKDAGAGPTRPTDSAALYRDLRQVLSHRQIWLAGIYRGFTLGQMLSFGYVWDIPFQMAHYNDLSKSVAINSSVLIGFGLGSATIGWISDRVGRRVWPMRVTALAMLVPMACIIRYPMLDYWVGAGLLFFFGFACGGAALGHAVGVESSPRHLTATALGFVSTIAYVMAGILQIVPGILLDLTPASSSPSGVVCHYTIGQYCDSFVVFPVASICAFVTTLMIRESFPDRSPR